MSKQIDLGYVEKEFEIAKWHLTLAVIELQKAPDFDRTTKEMKECIGDLETTITILNQITNPIESEGVCLHLSHELGHKKCLSCGINLDPKTGKPLTPKEERDD